MKGKHIMSDLLFENKKWAISKGDGMVFISQVGPWGQSSYAFWPKNHDSPMSHDFNTRDRWSTNYPLDKIPKHIIDKARKYLNSME